MALLTALRRRLSNISSPQKAIPTTNNTADVPTALLRRLHRKRPSDSSSDSIPLPGRLRRKRPTSPSDSDSSSDSPPFVRRAGRKRSTSDPTPPEITDSVTYAKACSAYLCGRAASVRELALRIWQSNDTSQPHAEQAFEQARRGLLMEFEIFEMDQVQWAGYLMEGSRVDSKDEERARLFVQEGMEIMHAVDRARMEVDWACTL